MYGVEKKLVMGMKKLFYEGSEACVKIRRKVSASDVLIYWYQYRPKLAAILGKIA